MSKNEQFDGEFTESDPNNGSAKQPISKQQGLGKVFLKIGRASCRERV